jgi:dephospho-CoA kinase
VRGLLADRIAHARRGGAGVVVVEVPLLVEAIRADGGWTRIYDEIWVVTAPQRQVIDRLLARGGMDEARIRAVIDAQASPEQRRRYADVVIDNSAGIDRLCERVAELWGERLARP